MLPKVGASEASLTVVELQPGEGIDPGYRDLSYGDGWPALVINLQLIGGQDLRGEWRAAADVRLEKQWELPRPGRDGPDLFSFDVDPDVDIETEDVAVNGRPGTSMAARCLRMGGVILDDCASFKQWCEVQMDYHRTVLDRGAVEGWPDAPGARGD